MTNFIFMVAGDLDYADLGYYGGRSNCSPNLDQLAANGVRYVNGYANAPVCSPTRFALMTGRYQYWVHGASEEPILRHHDRIAVAPYWLLARPLFASALAETRTPPCS